MSESKMNAEQEKKLFEDMESLKKSSNETGITIALIEQQITYLVNSFKELVSLATEEDLNKLKLRVKLLEDEKLVRETIAELTTKRQMWWSNNWHKVFMVVVVCIPVITALYNLLSSPAKGG